MVIDTHAHFVPPRLFAALREREAHFPNVKMTGDDEAGYRFSFGDAPPTRPVAPGLIDLERRRAWMASQGIDVQVVGGWLDVFGYELPADEGAEWSRFFNGLLNEALAEDPAFVALATVPLQSGKLAARVLEEAMDAGFPGAMIGTWAQGRELDDPDLEPFWQVASERGAVIFIHPAYAGGEERLRDFGLANAVGRVAETTLAVTRMLYSATLQRFPGVRVVLSHGGGALPWVLGRLCHNRTLDIANRADPLEGFMRLYFDTIVYDPTALRFLYEKAGGERIVLGSDYPLPIGDFEPTKVVHAAGLSDDDTRKILGETAAELFRVKPR